MNTSRSSQSGIFTPRAVVAFTLFACGVVLGMFSLAAAPAGAGRSTAASVSTAASWQVVSSPNVFGALGNFFNSVACVDDKNCWAVGYYTSSNPPYNSQALIEHWDGDSWTVVPLTNSGGTQPSTLSGVTCVTSSDCWAVGDSTTEHWNGNAWVVVNSLTGLKLLQSVTCVTTSDCWAVGRGFFGGDAYQTLTEHWNGRVWAIVSSPNTDPAQNNQLSGVSCAASSDCWAVGYTYNTSNPPNYQTLTEHWDGTSWSISAPVNNNPVQGYFLQGVKCTAANDCWAVGYIETGIPTQGTAVSQTLTEHWDGSSWSVVSSPNTGLTDTDLLFGVTCIAAPDCWTVGYYNQASNATPQPLTEHWDGNAWTIINAPSRAPGLDSLFYSVACTASVNCWAVGADLPESFAAPTTLVERYAVLPVSLNGVVSRRTHGTAGTFDINVPHSGLLFQDTFTYPNGNLAGNGRWTEDSPASGTEVQTSSGHAVIVPSGPNAIANLNRTYPHTDGSAIYAAFDLTVTAASSNDVYFFQYVASRATDRLFAKAAGNGFVLGLQSSIADVVTYGTTVLSLNQTYRVVMTWNFIAGAQNDTMSIYVDPIDPAIESNNPPYLTYTWTTSGAQEPTAITDVRLGSSGSDGPSASIDNLAIGSSFGTVAALRDHGGIECRSGGANDAYTLVFTFSNTLASCGGASVASGAGSITSGSIDNNDAHKYIVNLTGVVNAQTLTLNLTDVTDSNGNFSSSVFAPMGVLLGDTTGDGVVNSADISQVRRQSGQVTTEANKRTDLTVDGVINSGDITLVRRQSGTALP